MKLFKYSDGNMFVIKGLFRKRLYQVLTLDQAYEIRFITSKEMEKINEKTK